MVKLLSTEFSVEEYLCYQVYGKPQICTNCGMTQEESLKRWNQKLGIHHKDNDHLNADEDNLFPTCRSCHPKVDKHIRENGKKNRVARIDWTCPICGKIRKLTETHAKHIITCSYECAGKYKETIWLRHPEKREEVSEKIRKTMRAQFANGRVSPMCNPEVAKKAHEKSMITRLAHIKDGSIHPGYNFVNYMKLHPEKLVRRKVCCQCGEEFIGHVNNKKCLICRESRQRLMNVIEV
jgi:hypothetical protein